MTPRPLDKLPISTRARNALAQDSMKTSADVEARRREIVFNMVPDLGPKGIGQVCAAMGWTGERWIL